MSRHASAVGAPMPLPMGATDITSTKPNDLATLMICARADLTDTLGATRALCGGGSGPCLNHRAFRREPRR
jgi:hypothetical protein